MSSFPEEVYSFGQLGCTFGGHWPCATKRLLYTLSNIEDRTVTNVVCCNFLQCRAFLILSTVRRSSKTGQCHVFKPVGLETKKSRQ